MAPAIVQRSRRLGRSLAVGFLELLPGCRSYASVMESSMPASSVPEAGRCHGSLARQQRITVSSRGSMRGLRRRGSGRPSLHVHGRDIERREATKGSVPVAKEHDDTTGVEIALREHVGGSRLFGAHVVWCAHHDPDFGEDPSETTGHMGHAKIVDLHDLAVRGGASGSSRTRRFSGLRSRWMTPSPWA